MQLAVAVPGVFGGLVAFPDDRRLVAPRRQVPVEAVVGDVGLAALEPLDVDGSRAQIEVVVADLVPLLEPVELGGLLGPELVGVLDRARVLVAVLLHALDVGFLLKRRLRREHF